MSKNSIYAVIITYNVDSDIKEVVKAIINDVHKVIIVDNGSKQETIDLLELLEREERIKIIYNNNNLGIAKALNIGIENAINEGAEWILTLDHDSKAHENMVGQMLRGYNSLTEDMKNSTAILVPEIIDTSIDKWLNKVEYVNGFKEVDHAIQSGSLVKAQLFKEIGYFNEELFIYYVDDEFCFRVKEVNKRVIQIKDAKLFHKEGNKERRKFLNKNFTYDNYSVYAIYYITRNSIYMFKNYKKFEFLKRIIYDFIKIMLLEPKKIKYLLIGIKDGILNKYGKKFD